MLAALTLTPCLGGRPASIGWHHGLVRFLCDGASNERQPMRLLPLRRLAPALEPIISRATRATDGVNDMGGGEVGELVSEGHGQTVSRKNKSAMPKIELAKRRQCQHSNPMTATRAERIILRSTPCRCGCNGTDPWHRKTVKRVVTKTSKTEGTIRMPYGEVAVFRKEYVGPATGRQMFGVWQKSK